MGLRLGPGVFYVFNIGSWWILQEEGFVGCPGAGEVEGPGKGRAGGNESGDVKMRGCLPRGRGG